MQGTSIEKEDYRANYSLILLAGMFIIGMIYGVLLIKSNSDSLANTISIITNEYTIKLQQGSIWQGFWSSFVSTFIFIFLPYLLGYSAIAQPLILFVPWFKGLGLGFFMANLYTSYGFRGIGFCALVIMPSTLVALFCILIASREALKLSNLFFQSFASKRHSAVSLTTIKLYNLKLLVLSFISLIASIINVVCVLLFSELFNFI
ncbi:MAG: stage II sporulation protein M [Oscillospiraceae bacterium]